MLLPRLAAAALAGCLFALTPAPGPAAPAGPAADAKPLAGAEGPAAARPDAAPAAGLAGKPSAGDAAAAAARPGPARLPLCGLAPAKLVPDLCLVRYRISTSSPECQAFFDQGLGYYYSYVWMEAARSF